MMWKKPKDETVVLKMHGQTLHFQTSRKLAKKDGLTITFYEQLFQEKPKTTIKNTEPTPKPAEKNKQITENRTKKQEMIEQMFEMSLDDLALKLNTLQKEAEKNRKLIHEYANREEEMKNFLHQMIKKELYLNKEIAEPVLMQYEVHPEHKLYQRELSNPKQSLEALFYVQHCHRADILDMMEEVRKAKQDNRSLGMALEEMQKIQDQLKEERMAEQGKMQKAVAEFKEKYAIIQKEIGEKQQQIQQLEKQNQLLQKEKEQAIQEKEEARKRAEQEKISAVEIIEEIEVIEEIEEIAEANDDSLDEIHIPAEAFVTKAKKVKEVKEEQTKKEEKEEELALSLMDFDFMGELDVAHDVPEEMPYISLLKEKGYEVEISENKDHDWMIAKETGEKIPLMYIYYDIEKPDEFDTLMKDTDKIYFVFDSKKRMFKGNTKFTSWLLKQKERKTNVQFSFTTMDQLKTNGLNTLDKM